MPSYNYTHPYTPSGVLSMRALKFIFRKVKNAYSVCPNACEVIKSNTHLSHRGEIKRFALFDDMFSSTYLRISSPNSGV